MIDRSCHKTRAENAEAATETRRSLHTYLDVRSLTFDHLDSIYADPHDTLFTVDLAV
jgi:hypothetical protein